MVRRDVLSVRDLPGLERVLLAVPLGGGSLGTVFDNARGPLEEWMRGFSSDADGISAK